MNTKRRGSLGAVSEAAHHSQVSVLRGYMTKGSVASGLYLVLAKPWSECLSAAFIRIQAEFNIMQSAACQLPAWPMKQCKSLCPEVNHLHQNPVLFRTKFSSKISEK